jgi:hypothetical protein
MGMSLSKDNKKQRQQQTRTGKIVMWIIFGIAAVLAIIAIVIWIGSGVSLF